MTIPGKELVGRNPSLVDGIYSDDYMVALNKFTTVDEVFGEHKEAIARGDRLIIPRIVMGTLDRAEYENHLVSLVMTAAKDGEWRAVERKPGIHIEGLDVVTNRSFGHVTKF